MVLRILIADDHLELREILKVLLESHEGWQVCGAATNGLEAVQKAAELKPDIIILDLSMPEMDGLQAASQISSSSPDVPILIHTNHALAPETIRETRKHGVWDVLNKAASPTRLLNAIEKLQTQLTGGVAKRLSELKGTGVTKAEFSLPEPSAEEPEES